MSLRQSTDFNDFVYSLLITNVTQSKQVVVFILLPLVLLTIPITIRTGGESKVKLRFFCVNLPE